MLRTPFLPVQGLVQLWIYCSADHSRAGLWYLRLFVIDHMFIFKSKLSQAIHATQHWTVEVGFGEHTECPCWGKKWRSLQYPPSERFYTPPSRVPSSSCHLDMVPSTVRTHPGVVWPHLAQTKATRSCWASPLPSWGHGDRAGARSDGGVTALSCAHCSLGTHQIRADPLSSSGSQPTGAGILPEPFLPISGSFSPLSPAPPPAGWEFVV